MTFDPEIFRKVCQTSISLGEKAVYSTDSSGIKGEALAILWPTDYEQLKQVIRLASRDGIPVVPRGGGTSLVGGAVPNKGVVLDLSRLNKIKKLYMGDKLAVVQSGVVLDKLNEALAEFNLEFPVVPDSHTSCTIGGMIATNAAGLLPSRMAFIKEWVKDVTFMDGTGKVYTLEGNEARRFIGTEGCSGVIMEATLKLTDRKNYSTDLFKFSDLHALMAKVQELSNDKNVAAVEYINKAASSLVGLGGNEHLLVKYSDNRGAIDPAEAEDLWQMHDNFYSMLSEAGYPRAEDVLFEKDSDKFIDWVNKQEIPCYGKIAIGSLHPHLKNADEVDKIASVVNELKGKMVGIHGVGMLRKKYTPLGASQNLKEFKAKYDPKNILNRGKVI